MPGITITTLEILTAIVSFLALVRANLEVIQVQALFRHGERTPTPNEMYPNDIYNASVYEPWGLGQLTNKGKMREFKIGELLKTRYQGLLGTLYLPKTIHAVSTDVDRTKMSLQLVLAGLFPPSKAQTWNPELPWIPIPTHYVPRELDIVMVPQDCPAFREATSEAWQFPEVKAKVKSHADLFRFLTIKTGLNITTVKQVYQIHNLLDSQIGMNLALPDWCTDRILREIRQVTILQYEIWSYSPKIKRINGGHAVREFIGNMRLGSAEGTRQKMYLYSTHESTVAAFLRAHGITELEIPLYGTAVMFEKLRDNDGKLFVRLVLWTGVTERLITLRLPGCDEICPMERYLDLTRRIIPSDEERGCRWRCLSSQQLRNMFEL